MAFFDNVLGTAAKLLSKAVSHSVTDPVTKKPISVTEDNLASPFQSADPAIASGASTQLPIGPVAPVTPNIGAIQAGAVAETPQQLPVGQTMPEQPTRTLPTLADIIAMTQQEDDALAEEESIEEQAKADSDTPFSGESKRGPVLWNTPVDITEPIDIGALTPLQPQGETISEQESQSPSNPFLSGVMNVFQKVSEGQEARYDMKREFAKETIDRWSDTFQQMKIISDKRKTDQVKRAEEIKRVKESGTIDPTTYIPLKNDLSWNEYLGRLGPVLGGLWYAGQWVENATRPMLSYIDNENFRNVYWSSVTNQAPPDVVVNNSAEANILISTHKKDFTDIIMTGEGKAFKNEAVDVLNAYGVYLYTQNYAEDFTDDEKLLAIEKLNLAVNVTDAFPDEFNKMDFADKLSYLNTYYFKYHDQLTATNKLISEVSAELAYKSYNNIAAKQKYAITEDDLVEAEIFEQQIESNKSTYLTSPATRINAVTASERFDDAMNRSSNNSIIMQAQYYNDESDELISQMEDLYGKKFREDPAIDKSIYNFYLDIVSNKAIINKKMDQFYTMRSWIAEKGDGTAKNGIIPDERLGKDVDAANNALGYKALEMEKKDFEGRGIGLTALVTADVGTYIQVQLTRMRALKNAYLVDPSLNIEVDVGRRNAMTLWGLPSILMSYGNAIAQTSAAGLLQMFSDVKEDAVGTPLESVPLYRGDIASESDLYGDIPGKVKSFSDTFTDATNNIIQYAPEIINTAWQIKQTGKIFDKIIAGFGATGIAELNAGSVGWKTFIKIMNNRFLQKGKLGETVTADVKIRYFVDAFTRLGVKARGENIVMGEQFGAILPQGYTSEDLTFDIWFSTAESALRVTKMFSALNINKIQAINIFKQEMAKQALKGVTDEMWAGLSEAQRLLYTEAVEDIYAAGKERFDSAVVTQVENLPNGGKVATYYNGYEVLYDVDGSPYLVPTGKGIAVKKAMTWQDQMNNMLQVFGDQYTKEIDALQAQITENLRAVTNKLFKGVSESRFMKAIKNLDNIAKREGREVTTAEIIRELGFSEFEMRKAYQDVLKDKMKAAKELLKKNNVLERQVRKILRTTMDDGTELPKDVSDYLNKSNAEKFIVWDDEEKMLFRIWQIETYGVKNFKPLEVRRQINEFATIRMEKHWERLGLIRKEKKAENLQTLREYGRGLKEKAIDVGDTVVTKRVGDELETKVVAAVDDTIFNPKKAHDDLMRTIKNLKRQRKMAAQEAGRELTEQNLTRRWNPKKTYAEFLEDFNIGSEDATYIDETFYNFVVNTKGSKAQKVKALFNEYLMRSVRGDPDPYLPIKMRRNRKQVERIKDNLSHVFSSAEEYFKWREEYLRSGLFPEELKKRIPYHKKGKPPLTSGDVNRLLSDPDFYSIINTTTAYTAIMHKDFNEATYLQKTLPRMKATTALTPSFTSPTALEFYVGKKGYISMGTPPTVGSKGEIVGGINKVYSYKVTKRGNNYIMTLTSLDIRATDQAAKPEVIVFSTLPDDPDGLMYMQKIGGDQGYVAFFKGDTNMQRMEAYKNFSEFENEYYRIQASVKDLKKKIKAAQTRYNYLDYRTLVARRIYDKSDALSFAVQRFSKMSPTALAKIDPDSLQAIDYMAYRGVQEMLIKKTQALAMNEAAGGDNAVISRRGDIKLRDYIRNISSEGSDKAFPRKKGETIGERKLRRMNEEDHISETAQELYDGDLIDTSSESYNHLNDDQRAGSFGDRTDLYDLGPTVKEINQQYTREMAEKLAREARDDLIDGLPGEQVDELIAKTVYGKAPEFKSLLKKSKKEMVDDAVMRALSEATSDAEKAAIKSEYKLWLVDYKNNLADQRDAIVRRIDTDDEYGIKYIDTPIDAPSEMPWNADPKFADQPKQVYSDGKPVEGGKPSHDNDGQVIVQQNRQQAKSQKILSYSKKLFGEELGGRTEELIRVESMYKKYMMLNPKAKQVLKVADPDGDGFALFLEAAWSNHGDPRFKVFANYRDTPAGEYGRFGQKPIPVKDFVSPYGYTNHEMAGWKPKEVRNVTIDEVRRYEKDYYDYRTTPNAAGVIPPHKELPNVDTLGLIMKSGTSYVFPFEHGGTKFRTVIFRLSKNEHIMGAYEHSRGNIYVKRVYALQEGTKTSWIPIERWKADEAMTETVDVFAPDGSVAYQTKSIELPFSDEEKLTDPATRHEAGIKFEMDRINQFLNAERTNRSQGYPINSQELKGIDEKDAYLVRIDDLLVSDFDNYKSAMQLEFALNKNPALLELQKAGGDSRELYATFDLDDTTIGYLEKAQKKLADRLNDCGGDFN